MIRLLKLYYRSILKYWVYYNVLMVALLLYFSYQIEDQYRTDAQSAGTSFLNRIEHIVVVSSFILPFVYFGGVTCGFINKNLNWLIRLPTKRRALFVGNSLLCLALTLMNFGAAFGIHLLDAFLKNGTQFVSLESLDSILGFFLLPLFLARGLIHYFLDPNNLAESLIVSIPLSIVASVLLAQPLSHNFRKQLLMKAQQGHQKNDFVSILKVFCFSAVLMTVGYWILSINTILIPFLFLIGINFMVALLTINGLALDKSRANALLGTQFALFILPMLLILGQLWIYAPQLNTSSTATLLRSSVFAFAPRLEREQFHKLLLSDHADSNFKDWKQIYEKRFATKLSEHDFVLALQNQKNFFRMNDFLDAWNTKKLSSYALWNFLTHLEFNEGLVTAEKGNHMRNWLSKKRDSQDVLFMLKSSSTPIKNIGLVWARYFPSDKIREHLNANERNYFSSQEGLYSKTRRILRDDSDRKIASNDDCSTLSSKGAEKLVQEKKNLERCIRSWSLETGFRSDPDSDIEKIEESSWDQKEPLSDAQKTYLKRVLAKL